MERFDKEPNNLSYAIIILEKERRYSMEEKLKAYCENEYEQCCQGEDWDVEKAIDRCYGAVMFCITNCFPSFNEELGDWWNDEMLPKFRKL